jgi:hypothetical protein
MGWKPINAFRAIGVSLILAAGVLLATSIRADEETPAWQQPPGAQSDDGGPCGDCAEGGCEEGAACGPFAWPSFMPQDDWVRIDALLWWTKGAILPPLLTTSPDGTAKNDAGVLGQPGTSILFGNQEVNGGFRPGGRISFGTWLDCADNVGIEMSYLTLSQSVTSYNASSTGSPILARPFFNVDASPGAEDSVVLAYKSTDVQQSGTFAATSTSNFQVAEVLMRRGIARACDYRVELLAGYRFQQLTDGLDIASTTTTATDPTVSTFDEFHTRNDFNGAVIGVAGELRRCRWSLETTLKLALGDTHSQIDINGSSTLPSGTYNAGMLALASNIGEYKLDQFTAVPELGLTLAYDLSCHLRATFGYSLIYWSDVARPGDQIDLNISPRQFPPPTGTSEKPAFVLRTTDYWAQGLNLGLDYRF